MDSPTAMVAISLSLVGWTVACASAPPNVSNDTADLPIHGEVDELGRIGYLGAIRDSANLVVMQTFDAAEPKPVTLLIASPGGDVASALDLAEWMLDHDLDVEVAGGCFSSCANYVFLAGRTKKLRRDSWVGWHGSSWSESFGGISESDRGAFLESIRGLRERETQFFSRVGVDNLITVYGQLEGLGPGPEVGWDYGLQDLVRMGVTGIHLIDGEWNWREHRRATSRQIWRTSLGDDYVFTPRRFTVEAPAPSAR